MPDIESASLDQKTFKRTPAGIESPEKSPNRLVFPSTSTSSSPSSTKRRRSVSSMKGLMPFALSPSLSTFGSTSQTVAIDDDTTEDGGVPGSDDCLPEVLARDLEMSSEVFASKDLTAGPPRAASIPDEKVRGRTGKTALSSPYLTASARVQVLGAIEERKSIVSFLGQHDPILVDHHSDSASVTSRSSSEEAAPPSFRHRGSVVTTATSVGSVGFKTRIPSLPQDPHESSWMEADSDRDEKEDDLFEDCNVGSLRPRPPTPSGADLGIRVKAAVPRAYMPLTRSDASHASHRKSHSINGDTGMKTSQRRSEERPAKLPQRSSSVASFQPRASISYANCNLSPSLGNPAHDSARKARRTQTLDIDTVSSNTLFTSSARDVAVGPSRNRDLSPTSHSFSDSDDEVLYSPRRKRTQKNNAVFTRPLSPPQPLRSVQSWLNSSSQPCAWASWTPYNEDNARALPLPPDAVENLRVSVACFPETMLLTSSLTVETIRSYAKKVRQPSTDCSGAMNGDVLLPDSPRKSLWRKVVPHRRGSQPFENRTSPGPLSSRHGHGSAPGSSAFLDTPKPWASLKNVFGFCSDYICDALYAHIVAYNYVSAVVARSPTSHSAHGRSSMASIRDSQSQDEIPKKAASLLGLSAGCGDVPASMGRYSQRLGSQLGDWTREGTMTRRDTGQTPHDSAMRAIQSGLLRCISRLVTTAKLMSENGTGEEGLVELETEEADMLLMRSLCEIVRMAEDSA
ncbi:hypothetical protein E4U42_005240 [Claviceps africana]|uniref:Uncharacterized protein n=1 Tax=Claviceps africana TaxID=83212 RepID=A0A8K0J6T7_9HYPO|nr:hypothetical protein E4U42_005240 [Claviceps africana]